MKKLGMPALALALVFGFATRCDSADAKTEAASNDAKRAEATASPSASATPESDRRQKLRDEAAKRDAQAKKDLEKREAEWAAKEEKRAEEKRRASAKIVTMPDLVGLNLKIANIAIENAGLTNAKVCTTPGGELVFKPSNWRVLTQSVKPGKRIRGGTEVCLGAMKNEDF